MQLARRGQFAEEERKLQDQINTLQAQSRIKGETEDGEGETDGGRLTQNLQEARQAYDTFLAKARKEDSEQASLINVEPLKLKRIQELLDPGVTVMEYFVPQRGTAMLWVVNRDSLRFVEVKINRADLVKKVTTLRETISQVGEPEKLNQQAQELYNLLVQPGLSHIRGKELIIVPHDLLHNLPFHALGGSDGRYLIEKAPIQYLSSASLMQFTQAKRRALGKKVLAFGNPVGDESVKELKFAEQEIMELENYFRRRRCCEETKRPRTRSKPWRMTTTFCTLPLTRS